jgi:hypothetical protein
MTLKEAKRAHKKDGGPVRYTASQMARADRADAKKAQVKKELEKEKQRAANKRKREEKEERDRRVKQKMLEEGRISVEDTWGKVTASQPRLNKFFGRPAAVQARATSADGEDQDPIRIEAALEDPLSEDDQGRTEPETAARLEQTGTLEPPESNLGGLLRASQAPSVGDRAGALKEAAHSELNALTHSALAKLDATAPKHTQSQKPTFLPQQSLRTSNAGLKPTPSTSWRSSSDIQTPSRDRNPLIEAVRSPNVPQDPSTIETDQVVENKPHTKNQALNGECGQSLSPGARESEEDFADELDDEIFLLLCATQKPVQPDKQEMPGPDAQVSGPAPASMAIRPLLPQPQPSHAPDLQIKQCEKVDASTENNNKSLTQSFGSVFNDIDDDELVALAEIVEAELSTPKPSSNLSTEGVPTSESANVSKTPELSLLVQKPNFQPLPGSRSTGAQTPRRPIAGGQQASSKMTSSVTSSCKPGLVVSNRPVLQSSKGVAVKVVHQIQATGKNLGPQATIASAQGNPERADSKHATTTPNARVTSRATQRTPTSSSSLTTPKVALNPPIPQLPTPPMKSKRKRRYPPSFHPPADEFPDMGLGPATQAFALELLKQAEAEASRRPSNANMILK